MAATDISHLAEGPSGDRKAFPEVTAKSLDTLAAELMSDSDVSKERAMDLLQLYSNDATRARRHLMLESKFLSPADSLSRQSSCTIRATPTGEAGNTAYKDISFDQDSARSSLSSGLHRDVRISTRLPLLSQEHSPTSISTRSPSQTDDAENTTQDERTERPIVTSSKDTQHARGSNPLIRSGGPDAEWVAPVAGIQDGKKALVGDLDLTLPRIPPPATLVPGNVGLASELNLRDLVGAVQNFMPLQDVSNYLGSFSKSDVHRCLNEKVEGVPSIFYIVAQNDEALLRLWVEKGAFVSVVHPPSGLPLLAFAILYGESLDVEIDTTQIIATLLWLGARPDAIPVEFYKRYVDDIPDDMEPGQGDEGDAEWPDWCTGTAKKALAESTNLTHRYYLWKATHMKKATFRQRQVARLRKAESLLGIDYFLVGQSVASSRLLQRLLTFMMSPARRPLVLVFAGPSGHGKTELARRLGRLLTLDMEVVDCTIVQREMELFGPRPPYVGSDKGAPLNNFLVRNAGKRCIVFLDEFEKTTKDIHQALLLPFDNGEYQDRRTLNKVDCTKAIWILATNALDQDIKDYCRDHEEIFSEDPSRRQAAAKMLSRKLKNSFLARFEPPLTGRISEFIPFLPFLPGEQAVVAHKFYRELRHRVRNPVRLDAGPGERLLGDVRLRMRRDGAVCSALAEDEYHMDTGARSLATAVAGVEDKLVEEYLSEQSSIAEGAAVMEFLVDERDRDVVVERVGA